MKKNQLQSGYLYNNLIVVHLLKFLDFFLNLMPIPKRSLPSSIKKILIMKPDHLGDLVLMTTILKPLKERFPNTQIDIVCHPMGKSFLENLKRLDNVFTISHFMHNRSSQSFPSKLYQFIKEFLSLRKRLKNEHYDLGINLRAFGGNLLSLMRFSNIRYIIGHTTGGFGHFADATAVWKEDCHESYHYQEVLGLIGINNYSAKYALEPKRSLSLPSILEGKKYMTLHPGSGDSRKIPSLNFWENYLKHEKDYPIALCGLDEEKKWVPLLNQKFEIIDLTGKYSLWDLFNIFKFSEKNITLDSVSAHLAAASGTPTTILFTPYSDPSQWKPLGANTKIDYIMEKQ